MAHRLFIFMERAIGTPMLLALAFVSAIAPLSTDMYLPGLPEMADALDTSASNIQLTLTAFMAGMGLGQLIIGPWSDGVGRHRILMVATTLTAVAAFVGAGAPSVWVLIAARLVQGFAGGSAVVLARAAIADRTTGPEAAKLFSIMMSIGGVAPVAAPLLGGVLIDSVGWRGIFVVMGALSALQVAAALFFIPETLPPERRHTGGFRPVLAGMRVVVTSRRYLGYAFGLVFAFGAMFSYISASSFVFQSVLGMSPAMYSLAFSVGAVLLIFSGLLSARLVGRFTPRALLIYGLAQMLTFASIVFVVVLTVAVPPWWAVVVPLWLMVTSMGFVFGNATGLAQSQVPQYAGAGSAVIGAAQFGLAALVAPIVGVAGPNSAVPLAVSLPIWALLGMASVLWVSRGKEPERYVGAVTSVDV